MSLISAKDESQSGLFQGESGPTLHTPVSSAAARFFAPVKSRFSKVILAGLVRSAEFALIFISGIIAFHLRNRDAWDPPLIYIFLISGMAACSTVLFESMKLYTVPALRDFLRTGVILLAAWSGVIGAATTLIFLLKLQEAYSRIWLANWYFLALALLISERLFVQRFVLSLAKAGRLALRTVIVGGGPEAEDLLQQLASKPDPELQVLGVFDDRADARSPGKVAGFPKLGNVEDLITCARQTRIDVAIISLPIAAEHRVLQLLRRLWVLPIDIRLATHRSKLKLRPRSYSYLSTVPVLDVFDKPIADWDVVTKYIFDKIIGTIALIALSPILIAAAIAVKLDSPGPILFRQKRHGFNNEVIEVYKFRSMYADMTDHGALRQVTRDDPRVTRVGRFLRRSSIDELPQLFNVVFKGNLSLVGPRPHSISGKAADVEYHELVDGYFARHRMKPGLTGWAQINGWRGETDTPEKMQNRVDHDLYYIENWSIFLDAYILMMTPIALLRSDAAY